jgi:hypothetical protein
MAPEKGQEKTPEFPETSVWRSALQLLEDTSPHGQTHLDVADMQERKKSLKKCMQEVFAAADCKHKEN